MCDWIVSYTTDWLIKFLVIFFVRKFTDIYLDYIATILTSYPHNNPHKLYQKILKIPSEKVDAATYTAPC